LSFCWRVWKSQGRKGEVFSIVSEAGCGKSRLLYEFRKGIVNEMRSSWKASAFLTAKELYIPYRILKSSFNLRKEGDQQIRESWPTAQSDWSGRGYNSSLPLELLSSRQRIDRIPVGLKRKGENRRSHKANHRESLRDPPDDHRIEDCTG